MLSKTFQIFTYWPTYLILKVFADYRIEGRENLIGFENRAVIFASNHASYIDGPVCAAACPKRFFPIRFLVTKEYYKWINPFIFPLSIFAAAYVRINGSILVQKTGGDLNKSLFRTIKALNNGATIWIYPEGRLTKDGKIQQGKRGIAYLHQQTKAPIIPVGIIGTYKISFSKLILRESKIKVKIGKPIYSLGNASLEQGVDKVMGEIKKLAGEA